MAAAKQKNKKTAKKTSKKLNTQKKAASSKRGKASKKKPLRKPSKQQSIKRKKSHASKGQPLKAKKKKIGTKQPAKKSTADKSRSVLGKIQKQVTAFKKKVRGSLIKPHSPKKKPTSSTPQLLKNPMQKAKINKPQSLKKTSQKSTTSPQSLTKPPQGITVQPVKTQKRPETPPPAQKTTQKQPSPQKKSVSTNKLDMAKKDLAAILEEEKEEKLILKDMEGRSYCCVENCGFSAEVEGYCRLHYLGYWEHIIKRNKILKKGILEKLISQLVSNHSPNILNFLLQDLKQEKTFASIVKTLLEEDEDIESEDALLNN